MRQHGQQFPQGFFLYRCLSESESTLALCFVAVSTHAMNLQRMQEKSHPPEALLELSQQSQDSQLPQTSQQTEVGSFID
jgi:hypothetical protein